jgi:hypothetical protein
MSNARNVPYFDLGYARALSRKLRDSAPVVAERPVERPTFVRFPRFALRAASPTFDAATLGQTLRDVSDAWGASAWHALLDASTSAAAASGAFAMDAQGLVIATRGDLDEAQAERLGGRLMLTLDQAEKMSEHSGVVCVEVEGRWLTGIRAPSKSGVQVTVGVLASEPVGRDARAAITQLMSTIGG